ncbi:MAG: UDP-N-acetylmuramate dehydrogenase [Clostridiales bacterium]|nr:UDP-N-acetylmuramate dehydrogenase [Clostridiales bacterium]
MTQSRLDSLAQALPQNTLFKGSLLAPYTTIKVGGKAGLLMEVSDAQQVAMALAQARRMDIPVLLLGRGSNLVISDAGFDGLVIHFGQDFAQVTVEGTAIRAQAGASLMNVSRIATDECLTGLEFAAGIPASIGGATLMNAGAYGSEMASLITDVECLNPQGERLWLKKEELGYGYRTSRMMREGYTVLSIIMALRHGEQEMIRNLVADYQGRRREKQPITWPSAGSFFKRPEGYYAGALIEAAGLKGLKVGDAQVSELHCGFLINLGEATAEDFFNLAKLVQQRVQTASGVMLETEVRLIKGSVL